MSIIYGITDNKVSDNFDIIDLENKIELIYIAFEIILIGTLCFICTGWVVATISNEYGSYTQAQNCPLKDDQSQHPAKFRFLYIQNNPSYPASRNTKDANADNQGSNHDDNNNNNNNTLESNDDDYDGGTRIRYVYRTKKNLEDIEISKKLKLPQILSANESFTLFMQHLSRESHTACLLSFVEFVQFKELLKGKLRGIQAGTFGNAKLAPSIPKSIVVHTPYPMPQQMNNNNNDNIINGDNTNNNNNNNNNNKKNNDDQEALLLQYKCRAYMLYDKYIKVDAELPLRLQSEYKKALDDQMRDMDTLMKTNINPNQLFHIFDDVIFSQYQIMWKSYQRFVNTGDYQLVENLFNQQEKKK